MKSAIVVMAVALVVGGGTAGAQTAARPDVPQQDAPKQDAAKQVVAKQDAAKQDALPKPSPSVQDIQARRHQVQMMEGVLTAAVKNGASALAQRMQIVEPGSLIVTGTAGARGFVLEGYGVFFDVDVPAMRQSVVWSTRTLLNDQRKLDLRRAIASTPDGPDRQRLIAQLQQIDPTFRPERMRTAAPSPVSQGASGMVTAQSVPEPVVDPSDPNEQYTEAVKTALMDAMLDYSGLNLGSDEWLTVAARDSEGPLIPGMLEDKSTIILRVRGRDLIAYQARQITREEARQRVEVKEF